MSRMRLAVLLAFVFACTDQNEPTGRPVTDGPDNVTLEDGASGIELELDLADSRNEAHTALSGGATTIFDESEEAFGSPTPNLQGENVERHGVRQRMAHATALGDRTLRVRHRPHALPP